MSIQNMVAKAARCYLCGKILSQEEITRDHVPPKGLFPRPLPSNLITVACCKPCNNGKSGEEELFRLFATLGVKQTPEAESVYFFRTLPHTIAGRRLKSEVRAILDSLQYIWTEIDHVVQPIPITPFPVRKLCRVVERIARGLTAHFHPDLAVHELSFEASIPTRRVFFDVFEALALDLLEVRLGGRTFHAYHGVTNESANVGVWIMTFHERIPAVVLHFDSDHSELSSSRDRLVITP